MVKVEAGQIQVSLKTDTSETPEPTRDQMRAPRVLVISLQKSGTHLLTELFHTLGYRLYGAARIPLEQKPNFSRDEKRRLVRLVFVTRIVLK